MYLTLHCYIRNKLFVIEILISFNTPYLFLRFEFPIPNVCDWWSYHELNIIPCDLDNVNWKVVQVHPSLSTCVGGKGLPSCWMLPTRYIYSVSSVWYRQRGIKTKIKHFRSMIILPNQIQLLWMVNRPVELSSTIVYHC